MVEDDSAKRERLAQLFGEGAAAKIAKRSSPAKKSPKEEPPEIQMLIEGMQSLQWGQIRLIDVDMAPGPLECEVAPLLEASSLLCCRLDMPLGLLLEEEEEGAMVVAELLDEGCAKAGGVQVGDMLRATTGVSMQMSYPTWQVCRTRSTQPTTIT